MLAEPQPVEVPRVEVDVVCQHETRLAFAFDDPKRQDKVVWLRKEDVRWPGRGFEREKLRTIIIPRWLADSHGFVP